jgi:hypothetical protein
MAEFEFDEFEDGASVEEVVEAVAHFVGHPEFLMEPAIGFAA